MSHPLSVSVVIPCFNEAGNVRACVETVPVMGGSTEIVFVDDGSSDDTKGEVERLKDLRSDVEVRLVSYAPNRGKGHAVKQGFDAARGDVVMILDADLAVPAAELPKFYDVLAAGDAGFVNGTRFILPMEKGAMRPLNRFGNRVFALLFSVLLGQRLTDTLCGTKVLLKKDYDRIEMSRCPWGDFDLIIGAAKLGLKITEVPVPYKRRTAGESKMKAFRHGWQLLKVWFRALRELRVNRFP